MGSINNKNKKNNKQNKTILYVFILIIVFLFSSAINKNFSGNYSFIKLSDFMAAAKNGQIEKANVLNETVMGTLKDGSKFKVFFPEIYIGKIIDTLTQENVNYDFTAIDGSKSIFERIISLLFGVLSSLPMILISLWFLFPLFSMRKRKKNNGNSDDFSIFGNPFSFGKSKAKAMMPNELNVKFSDVAGIDEAKEDVVELVDFLRDPAKYYDIGGRIPRGCLLCGQPGTGKTLLAKAIACEAKVPFFFISGSDFVEMFVGVGASRVRDMFLQAKKQSPCIVFIDEIDAVGRNRASGNFGGNDEREQTLNQLLVEMDGFQERSGIIVLAATNRPDVLDSALLRPGRFDRQIMVGLPDIKGRTDILKVHAKKVKMAPDVDLNSIARGTPGFSGADLANIINESALLAAKRNKKIITMEDVEDAKDKVIMGAERKNMIMKYEERKLTAYHEAGHAIVSINIQASDPIHKATIIPRGGALGSVTRLPTEDRFSETREQMLANMAVAMGGRVSEELNFGYDKVTSGASNDIKQCTNIARNMVIKWGLSEKVGKINYAQENDYQSNGKTISSDISQETAKLIDEEIKKLVDNAYETALKILKEKRKDLEILAEALLEYETLTGDEIKEL
jgi:cell division protease FtsH